MTTIRINDNIEKKLNDYAIKNFNMTFKQISKSFLLEKILKEIEK